MKLPAPIAHWQGYYDQYLKYMQTNGGRMTGAEADALESLGAIKPVLSYWNGESEIGDLLVSHGCAHIFRLQRFVAYKCLRRRITGKTPNQVFYYPPIIRYGVIT